MLPSFVDLLIDIQPLNIHVTQGDPAQFSCSFSGEHRVQREGVVWLKGIVVLCVVDAQLCLSSSPFLVCLDGRAIEADGNRVITITELVNVTLTTLQLVACRTSDRGSYRCTDGRFGQSREAKLYLQDTSEQIFLRSISSFSPRTVVSLFVFIFCFILFENDVSFIF